MDVRDVHALGRIAPHGALGHAAGLVGGVVQHLDLQEIARVVDPADGVDQPIRHVHLVIDGELDGDRRKGVERAGRDRLPVLVLHVEVHQVIPVPPVHGENDEDEEICGEYERFSGSHVMWQPADNTIVN